MLKPIKEVVAELAQHIQYVKAVDAVSLSKSNGGILLDVREPEEFAASPAKGAVNVPRGLLEMKLPQITNDAATPIYIYCATGMRATLAAEQLTRIGYENVQCIECEIPAIQQACSHC